MLTLLSAKCCDLTPDTTPRSYFTAFQREGTCGKHLADEFSRLRSRQSSFARVRERLALLAAAVEQRIMLMVRVAGTGRRKERGQGILRYSVAMVQWQASQRHPIAPQTVEPRIGFPHPICGLLRDCSPGLHKPSSRRS